MDNEKKRFAVRQLYVAIYHLEESKKDTHMRDSQEREAKRRIVSALGYLKGE